MKELVETGKSAYICGALTELSAEDQAWVKDFYRQIADLCEAVLGIRGFVPHEHYDPVKHANFSPPEVDEAERHQVCQYTSVLIVVTVAPSWGGGIEVEMANQSGVPVILVCDREKLKQRKISRLLRGNPAVAAVVEYGTVVEALAGLKRELARLLVPA